jgi:Micrococcal nuclease (thermonuclease) homologs
MTLIPDRPRALPACFVVFALAALLSCTRESSSVPSRETATDSRRSARPRRALDAPVPQPTRREPPPPAPPRTARIVRVIDGDSIRIHEADGFDREVRLLGIDAPEKSQEFGNRAKQNLQRLARGGAVQIEGKKIDRYGRLVARVSFDGNDLGLRQVRDGFAWVYRAYETELMLADRMRYSLAENEARRAHLGLWSESDPVPPWEYREANRLPRESNGSKGQAWDGHVAGNLRSHYYFLPGCSGYSQIAPSHLMRFASEADAQRAGYRRAPHC